MKTIVGSIEKNALLAYGGWLRRVAAALVVTVAVFGSFRVLASSEARQPNVTGLAQSRCPEVVALEKERDALSSAAESLHSPEWIFQRSTRNVEAEQRLAPLVEEALPNGRGCGHAFECRGLACRIELVVPESSAKSAPDAGACFASESRRAVSERATMIQGPTEAGSAFDPVSRTWMRKYAIHVRLASRAGDPVPRGRQSAPELPADWNRDRGPLPAGLAAACEAAVRKVRGEIDTLVRGMEKDLPPLKVFATSPANALLAGEVATKLRPCLAPGNQDLPVEVECRGRRLCMLTPRAGVRWDCTQNAAPRGACFGDRVGDTWFTRLMGCRDLRSTVEVLGGPWKQEGVVEFASALVRLRPPEEQGGVSGNTVVFQLARDRAFTEMVAGCERSHPARGVLLVTARVPDTCAASDDPYRRRIAVEYAGELFGSDLAACLAEKTGPVLESFELPRCTYGWTGEFRLEFPNPKIDIPAADGP